MQMQVEAERKKRAAILESEGIREAEINVAEGKRQAKILASEAQKQEQINHANGEAAAMIAVAEARANGLNIIAKSLVQPSFQRIHSCNSNFFFTPQMCRLSNSDGRSAASLTVAEQYVKAFDKLARTNNTLILPSNAGDISSLVGQAMSIYGTVSKSNQMNCDKIESGTTEDETTSNTSK